MKDIHFHGIWRMDWGLGNPNKTAALIAILMIAIWGLAYLRQGNGLGKSNEKGLGNDPANWGFWASLLPFTGLGICLIHTMSRGGLVALVAGLAPLIIMAPRPWPRTHVMALVAAFWIIIGATIVLNANLRYEQGILQQDRSISNRFQIWKTAPQMMVDAPGGWGLGNSGDAYMQWYQPLNSKEGYRTLVNSHLTWLVEMGWPLRLAYLFGWGVVLLLCWPGRETRWFALPLGIWTALAVAGAFSSVAESPFLWIVPIVSLLAVLVARIRYVEWPDVRCWLIPIGSAVAFCGFFYLIGSQTPSQFHRQGETLLFGSATPQVWLLPDSNILGKNLGRAIRRMGKKQALQTPSFSLGIVLNAEHIPSMKGERVIVAGNPASLDQLHRVFNEAASLELVNPGFFPEEVGVGKSDPYHKDMNLLIGEFSESAACGAWKEIAPCHLLVGVGEYIPDWSHLLLGSVPREAK